MMSDRILWNPHAASSCGQTTDRKQNQCVGLGHDRKDCAVQNIYDAKVAGAVLAERCEAAAEGYPDNGCPMKKIANCLGLHDATVS